MSLNRILMRMAIVSALTNFGKQPFPTVAKELIFDSKIEPSEQLEAPGSFQKPIAVVYTDYDKDFMVFRNKLQAKRSLSITLELLVVQASQSTDDEGDPVGTYELESPVTDSELEMTLDLFERQVFAAIQGDSPAGDFFNKTVIGYENVISRRGAGVTSGTRLAARQTTIEVDMLRDPRPGTLTDVTEAFLEACINEPMSDYAERAAMMRQLYLSDGGMNQFDFERKAMGITVADGERILGMPSKPYGRLPKLREIHWVTRDVGV